MKTATKRRVLILCTGNSCRSQMAEGLFREISGDAWEAHSAGSVPSGYVHPMAIDAMAQRGIDISDATSKSVSVYEGQAFDLVVTVCDHANRACPVFAGAKDRRHWPFDDPAEAKGDDARKMETFVRVRDQIEKQITAFLAP